MKLIIYRVIFVILLISAIIVLGLIAIKYGKNAINEKENEKVVEAFSNLELVQNNPEISQEKLTLNGYEVIGIIKIPKINIEYPILGIETSNPEETKEPMKYGIVRYWGDKVNDFGNLSIAGHNNYDGTMFGKTKRLEVGDIVQLTDLNKNTIEYEIYSKFVTDPNDITILATNDKTIREVTLITCTNGNKERLIFKAKEIL